MYIFTHIFCEESICMFKYTQWIPNMNLHISSLLEDHVSWGQPKPGELVNQYDDHEAASDTGAHPHHRATDHSICHPHTGLISHVQNNIYIFSDSTSFMILSLRKYYTMDLTWHFALTLNAYVFSEWRISREAHTAFWASERWGK